MKLADTLKALEAGGPGSGPRAGLGKQYKTLTGVLKKAGYEKSGRGHTGMYPTVSYSHKDGSSLTYVRNYGESWKHTSSGGVVTNGAGRIELQHHLLGE